MTNALNETAFCTPWTLLFERDGAEDYAVIRDADGEDLVASRPFWQPTEGDPVPSTLAAVRLMKAAPRLLDALITCANLLGDREGDGEAYREAVAAIEDAFGMAS